MSKFKKIPVFKTEDEERDFWANNDSSEFMDWKKKERVAFSKLLYRCPWPSGKTLDEKYHDEEWGVPVHDDRKLFEFILLDAFQAGLSWSTILNKRENFRKAFDNFEPEKIANYNEQKIQELLQDAGIIRNKLKIRSSVSNAQIFLEIQKEFGSFDTFIWQFVGGKPILNKWGNKEEIPVSTPESDAMSKALKKRGFKFVGTTICYAFMQAAGMVNDHLVECFRHKKVQHVYFF